MKMEKGSRYQETQIVSYGQVINKAGRERERERETSRLSAVILAFIRLFVIILREKRPFFFFFGLDCQKTA